MSHAKSKIIDFDKKFVCKLNLIILNHTAHTAHTVHTAVVIILDITGHLIKLIIILLVHNHM